VTIETGTGYELGPELWGRRPAAKAAAATIDFGGVLRSEWVASRPGSAIEGG
jgi:hypothetical protein